MPCGPHLIEAVARILDPTDGITPYRIQLLLSPDRFGHGQPRGEREPPTTRSIRYAIAELIKQGRAKRKGQHGPVYAVREDAE